MKKLLLLVTAVSALMAQDIAGYYRVSALDVQYYDIARQDVDINVQDKLGLGVELNLTTVNAGDLFYATHSGPYNEFILNTIGVNLNVNFYEDGTCSLAEGSFYPDVNEENCVSSVQVLPITDNMSYSSNLSALSPLPTTNMIGLPSISARAGQLAGGLSLDQALIFDYFPQGPAGYANQYSTDAEGNITGPGAAPVTIPTTINATDSGYPGWAGGTPLPGIHGGWVQVAAEGTDLGASQIPLYTNEAGENLYGVDVDGDGVDDVQLPVGNPSPNPHLFAEWHAIDGTASESGLGDFIGQDEDGFDGDLDRTFGLPVLPEATYFTGAAGCEAVGAWALDLGSTPVAGDVTDVLVDGVEAGCYGSVLAGVEAGCYAQVIAGVEGACEQAGGVFNTVFGGCVEQAQGDDFAAACAATDVATAVAGSCLEAGGPSESDPNVAGGLTCGDLGASYAGACAASDDPCQCAADYASSTDDNSLCSLAGGIGVATTADCAAFAGNLSTDYLNEQAAALTGATCPETLAVLSAGYAAGDATAIATLNGMAAAVTGADCPTTAAGWAANCIAGVDVATDVWVMDPSGAAAGYSNFVTMHGILASQCMETCVGYVVENYEYTVEAATGFCASTPLADPTQGPSGCADYFADDSDHAVDPTCLADGNPSDCSGRVTFNFAPTCIPEIEVRQVVIEAVAIGLDDSCELAGDVNSDGSTNVLDVVQTVAAILGNGTLSDTGAACADFNGDGSLNVLDVVQLVANILGNGRVDSASGVEIIKSSEGASFIADGYVGAIQMTINHGEDFSIEMTDKAMVADYNTKGNSTTLMVVDPQSSELFTAEGSYTIETVIAAANQDYIDISVPTSFSVGNAYPNPFNPTTSLNIDLDAASYVSVKVFNVMGQLIHTVAEGQMTKGTHAMTWDASTVSSGVYFINTEVGATLSSQKVMLLK